MTSDHFEECFAIKLLPNIPPNSLIVMSSYHSRRSEPVLVKSWTKQKMQDWLQAKGIEFTTNVLKAELYSIIQRLKPTPRYVVHDMAKAAGKYSLNFFYLLICTSYRARGDLTPCCSLHSQSSGIQGMTTIPTGHACQNHHHL